METKSIYTEIWWVWHYHYIMVKHNEQAYPVNQVAAMILAGSYWPMRIYCFLCTHFVFAFLALSLYLYYTFCSREFSVVKVHVTNLQGSVLNSYVTNPNPISDVLSSGVCATLDAFQSSISEKGGKIKLVDSTRWAKGYISALILDLDVYVLLLFCREVTSNLIAELEKTVDEFDRHQMLLENCQKERLMLSQQLELLTGMISK